MSSTVIILLRILHILAGVFWVGTVIFFNILLGPAVTAVGPDGAKVMQELMRRGYFERILAAATLAIVTGLLLVYQDSAGFNGVWFGTPFGRAISTGMLTAIIAWVMGVFYVRPALHELLELGGQMAGASADAREGIMTRMGAARGKVIRFGGLAMLFLLVTVITMAAARYL